MIRQKKIADRKLLRFSIQTLIISTVFFTIFKYSIVKAAQPVGITISPASFDIVTSQSDKISREFEVTNNYNSTIDLIVSKGLEKNGVINEEDVSWIETDTTEISLKQNETKKIKFDLSLPNNISFGETKLILFLKNNDGSSGDGIKLNFEIPIQINLFIQPLTKEDNGIAVEELAANNKISLINNFSIHYKVTNKSEQLYSKPILYLQIISPEGDIISKNVINEKLDSVVPLGSLEGDLAVSLPNSVINYIGQYHVELLAVDTLNNNSDIKKVTFVYVPYLDIIYAMLGVATLLLMTNVIKYYRIKKRKSTK